MDEKALSLERGDEVYAGRSRAEVRAVVLRLEAGTYILRRERGRTYVQLKPEVLARRARDRREPIGGYTSAPFFKKKTG